MKNQYGEFQIKNQDNNYKADVLQMKALEISINTNVKISGGIGIEQEIFNLTLMLFEFIMKL